MSSKYAEQKSSSCSDVHEALKCFRVFAQAEGHEGKLEGTKRSDGGLLDIAGVDRKSVICSNQSDLGEETATKKLMRVVMDVTDRIAVWNRTGVEHSIVSAETPTVALLGHYMQCRRPRTLRAASCAIPQHGVEFCFGISEPVRGEATWSAGD
jgi:hypothetical protein